MMKRALVTGGSGAIGAAICRRLAADGCHVYIHANGNLDRAQVVSAEIIAAGGSAHAVAFDVTAHAATTDAVQALLADGPIQIIVNNAGIHDDAVMPGMRADQWSRVLAVSLGGFFNVTQPLLMPMIGTRWGRIINLSSVAATAGRPTMQRPRPGCMAPPSRSRSNWQAAASRSTQLRRALLRRR